MVFLVSATSLVRAQITFNNLSGSYPTPYTGSVEGSFAVSATSGDWFVSTIYGNPGSSIYDGPVDSPGQGVLQISDSAGKFTLSAFDFSSNNGNSLYNIQGFLGSSLAYQETGMLPGTYGPFNFSTLMTANPNVAVDGLLISIIPLTGVTSVDLDNIDVATIPAAVVPEPGTYGVFGLVLMALVSLRAKTGK